MMCQVSVKKLLVKPITAFVEGNYLAMIKRHHSIPFMQELGLCSAVQCSAVQCSAVQCSAVQGVLPKGNSELPWVAISTPGGDT